MTILAQKTIGETIETILKNVISENTTRAYRRVLKEFEAWYIGQGPQDMNKKTIQLYVEKLKANRMNNSNINLHLICIRRLAAELADDGDLPEAAAAGIARVRGIRAEGRRLGNWLTMQQAQNLLDAPEISTLRGKRDKALLSVLLSCGLRREEAASLTMGHIQQRDGRWVIVDLIGKRNSMRSIPMPTWCKAAIDRWTEAAGINHGLIFRRIRRGDHLAGESMTDQAVYDVVLAYAKLLGLTLAAHDCRRTFAKLAHRGGSPIEQIQYSLGHASIVTTQIYLGACQNILDAPCDHLGLKL